MRGGRQNRCEDARSAIAAKKQFLIPKGQILNSLGSNLTLNDKNLQIQVKEPLMAIGQIVEAVPEAREGFEPKKLGQNEFKLEELYSKNPIVLSAMNKIRTWIVNNVESFYIPSFENLSKTME